MNGVLRSRLAMLAAAVLVAFSASAQTLPQNVTARQIQLPYYEGTVLKALFTGADARPLKEGNILVKGFAMQTFRDGDTNQVELTVEAPECVFNHFSQTAYSAGPLKVFNTATNFLIEGEGFFSRLSKTNAVLNISNKVYTVMKRGALPGTEPGPPIEIFSEQFSFVSHKEDTNEVRVATYTGNVRVEDPELLLTCLAIKVDLPIGTNKVERIVADRDVVIVNKADNSRAAGQRAVYRSIEGREVVSLGGNPTWTDGQIDGRAKRFVFDRTSRMIRAEQEGHLRLPRTALGTGDFLGTAGALPTPGTNQTVEITSEVFEIQLATAQRSARSMKAQNNVVIRDASDGSEGRGAAAVFDGATGTLQLTGGASWTAPQVEARGETLVLDRSNRVFKATQKAYLKLLSLEKSGAAGNAKEPVEIFADAYEVTTNLAIFRQNVMAHFAENGAPSRLACGALDVHLTNNQMERLVALTNVYWEQKPATLNNNSTTRKLTCQELTLFRSMATSRISRIVADTSVTMTEILHRENRDVTNRLSARHVDMRFAQNNQLEQLRAEENVLVEQGANRALGALATYTVNAEGEQFEITGKPVAQMRRTREDGSAEDLLISNADVLIWDPKTGRVRGKGPYRITPLSEKPSSTSE